MILYVEGSAGLSGDMLLSGFLDLGLPLVKLQGVLEKLGLSQVKIQRERIHREGIHAARVSFKERPRPPFRRAGDLIRFVRSSALEDSVKRLVVRAFTVLAHAEGAAHGRPWGMIHFHQLAQVDTLVDLAGLCTGLVHFNIDAVYTSPIPLGSRFQDSKGKWQAKPGPATQWLLRRFQTVRLNNSFEWTTPTGAVFLCAFASPKPAPPFEVYGIGHGVGHHRPPKGSSVLRLLLGCSCGLHLT